MGNATNTSPTGNIQQYINLRIWQKEPVRGPLTFQFRYQPEPKGPGRRSPQGAGGDGLAPEGGASTGVSGSDGISSGASRTRSRPGTDASHCTHLEQSPAQTLRPRARRGSTTSQFHSSGRGAQRDVVVSRLGLVLQLYFEPRIGAMVVAQLGDGLVAPPPAAPPQQQVHRRKPPPDERQQQTSYLLDGESDEESRPWRLRNAAIRFLRRGGPHPFGGGAGSSALASERAAARYAWATRHSVMWRYQPV